MKDFVNLHVQSHYSILQAIPTIDELVHSALESGQTALGLTDHNNMFAIPEFRKKTKQAGIKPIFGTKIDIMEQSRFTSQRKEDLPVTKYSLILFAKSFKGYQNLLKIVSHGYDDGSFGRFCVDKTLLSKFREDILVLSSDHTGELWNHAYQKKIDKLENAVKFYQEIFGQENFFIEIQDRKIDEDKQANKILIEYAQTNNIPLVATNPVKYINPEDNRLLEIVHCIKEKDFLKHSTSTHGNSYFKSYDEMKELFKEIPEALENTRKIAELCTIDFPKEEDQSPKYPIPENITACEYLKQKSRQELSIKFKGDIPKEYTDRLEWELETVCHMGFPNYFLVVSDFVKYAKKNGILVGPGRGSAAGALLSYVLDITNVDPLRYDLLFERFLNPERISMPDIDIDFEDERRDEVKQYLRTHYGANKTADVVTFGYNKSKAVLKDVGRVLEIPLVRVNQISGIVEANIDLQIQIEKLAELKSILTGDNQKEKNWINYSIKLANRIRNLGTHASALIVSDQTLNEIIPLFKDRSNTITTAFEGKYLEENGLLKMDILGLSNLSIIKDCITRIYENHFVWINLDEINLEDPKVFEMFSQGYTAGIFQFESTGMTNYIKQLMPTSIEDLIAMNALYRPGPMDSIPNFINRKQGLEEIDCFHPNLEPVLKNTYGIIVYQEQVMQIAQILSGFSLGEADIVRRIMAKKKPDELETIRPKWINGAVEQGYETALAEKLFELLIPFSNYAFNKSHAAAYSILAYQIAWLKAHYPAEFMASLMSSNMNNHEDLQKYIMESKNLGISILMPDVNNSFFDFQVEKFTPKDQEKIGIRYGLGAIKGLGENVSKEIIKERTWGGNFLSLEDFIERTSQNHEIRKASVEILLRAGAFDSLLNNEKLMLEKSIYLNSSNLNKLYNKYEKKESHNTLNLFSSEEMEAATDLLQTNGITPLTFEEDFQNEMKVFGFYLTQKLFSTITKDIGKLSTYYDSLKEILPISTKISLIGYITDIHIQKNQQNRNRSWGKFSLNTENEKIDFFIFGDLLDTFESSVTNGTFLFIKAQISKRKEQRSYELENFLILKNNTQPACGELNILLHNKKRNENSDLVFKKLQKLAYENYRNNAHHKIVFHIINTDTSINTYKAASSYRLHEPSIELQEILDDPIFLSYWFI